MTRLSTILLLSTALFTQSGGQTVNVPIQNPSFEDHPPFFTSVAINGTDCGPATYYAPGWQFIIVPGSGGTYGVFQPIVGSGPTWPCYNTQPPDGSVVAYVQSGTIFQDTGISVSSIQTYPGLGDGDGFYGMKFYVANGTNAYPGYYEFHILVGKIDPENVGASLAAAHELCGSDGWARRNWQQVTFTCPGPSYVIYDYWPPTSDKPTAAVSSPEDHYILSFSNSGGWNLLLDKVSLTFTPAQ